MQRVLFLCCRHFLASPGALPLLTSLCTADPLQASRVLLMAKVPDPARLAVSIQPLVMIWERCVLLPLFMQ